MVCVSIKQINKLVCTVVYNEHKLILRLFFYMYKQKKYNKSINYTSPLPLGYLD